MTEEQITAIAREYAEFTDLSPVDKKNISTICECFLKYILRRHCIVEKSKLEELDIPRRVKEHRALILDKRELDAIFSGMAKEVEDAG